MEPTIAGWTIMIVSLTAVCALTAFCFYRLMTLPPREVSEHIQPQRDMKPPD